MTDYTEVELGSNEVAEESMERCMDILNNQTAVEEKEMITVSQHIKPPKDPLSNKKSQEERRLCEKSTQCDLRDGGGLASRLDPSTTYKDNSVPTKPEGTESEGERESNERKKDEISQEDDQEPNSTLNTDTCLGLESKDQAVPVRRGRGRPRKSAVEPKVVQNGRRGRRVRVGNTSEKM